MFDFVRVALLATLSFASATAANPHLTPSKVDTLIDATDLPSSSSAATDTLDTPPVSAALPDPDSVPRLSPAKSLNELVDRHSTQSAADDEQECLATAVYFESKGEPLEGQLAVARTIINRATSGRFPSGLCGVIRQRGQFSFVHRSGAFPSVHREVRNWRTATAIARIAMDDLWSGAVRDALYFHAKRVAPHWGMTRLASLGNQVFYR